MLSLPYFSVKWGSFAAMCGFYALATRGGMPFIMPLPIYLNRLLARGVLMKKIAIALIACFAAASLAGCAGKGKAPIGKGKGKAPTAVVTKG